MMRYCFSLSLVAVWLTSGGCSRPEGAARVAISSEITGVLAGDTYAYLLRSQQGAVLVDTGSDKSGTALLAELARQGLTPEQVEAVLLTHGHRDHIAAAALFGAATVYVGEEDHTLIRGDRRSEGLFPRLLAHLDQAPPVHQGMRSLLAGSRVALAGRQFDVFAVPGHTRGSLLFLHQGILFSGDSLVRDGDSVDCAPAYTSGDRSLCLAALARLRGVSFEILADGHHGVVEDGGARFAHWLDAQP